MSSRPLQSRTSIPRANRHNDRDMPRVDYRGRRAVRIENDALAPHRARGRRSHRRDPRQVDRRQPAVDAAVAIVRAIEYDRAKHPEYGGGVDAALLAGIMGHNLCLDIFGGPSDAEAAAGLPVHGEASLVRYEIESSAPDHCRAREAAARESSRRAAAAAGGRLRARSRKASKTCRASITRLGGRSTSPSARRFSRKASPNSAPRRRVRRCSSVRLAPPTTSCPAPSSTGRMRLGPTAAQPTSGGRAAPRRRVPIRLTSWISGGRRHFSSHFRRRLGSRSATSGAAQDFPWLGIWEENASRPAAPWNGATLTRGMEFGASPFPETRREMIERGRLFDVSTFRWIPAASRVSVKYAVVVQPGETVPETLDWPA